jgi:DNA-binding NarL/FixJ family response regulator
MVRSALFGIFIEVGDKETEKMELKAARSTFHQLGAIPDITQIDSVLMGGHSGNFHGLSQREMEILAQVAKGLTNQAIADELCISKRTVERHVSNIFTKLSLSSRSALTAYAFEHQPV